MKRKLSGLFLFMLCLYLSRSIVSAAEPFEFHVLDVGNGQSVLVEADHHYMLIDGGGRDTSSFVVSYLKQSGVSKLDYVAASHYDEDHVAGLVGVLSVFPTDRLFVSAYAGQGALFDSFAVAAFSNGCDVIHPKAGTTYSLGSAEVQIVAPVKPEYGNENDRSLGFRIIYKDTSYLVCGDAEQQSELDMAGSGTDLTADVYVVNHHGSSTSTMDGFLDAVSPACAIISCGEGNEYGHPAMETLQRLQKRNIQMYRTDKQGTIAAYSDGQNIWFNTYPCEDWSSGIRTIPEEPTRTMPSEDNIVEEPAREDKGSGEAEQTYQYVCNTKTKRFHNPNCKSVDQMKEKNRLDTDLSREELIAEGYEPCGNCNP